MKEVTRSLIRIFNHKSFLVLGGVIVVALGVILLWDGPRPFDVVLLALTIAGLRILWDALRTTQTPGAETEDDLRALLANGARPTLVEFYSKHCVACVANKPLLDRLEREAGNRLQVVRLDVDEEPGKSLMDELDLLFTPTFVHFGPNGQHVRDTVGFVDRARILYELERS